MTRRVPTASPRPTLATVASEVGVSIATVSRALSSSDHPDIGADTRDRIRAAADRLGYVPSAAARSLRTGRSRTISMVVRPTEWISWGPVSVGAQAEARDRGYDLRLEMWEPADDPPDTVAARLRSRRDDGIIVVSMTPVSGIRETIDGIGSPAVFVDDVNDLPRDRVVCGTDRLGARLVTEHLLEAGHRRIAAVARPGTHRWVRERLAGYREAMSAAGRDPADELIVRADPSWATPDAPVPEIEQLLDRHPDAVMATADYLAAAVLRAAHRRGLGVPGQLAISGYDDERAAALVHPALTTVRQPFDEMGRVAVRLLDDAQREPLTPGVTELPVELVVRATSTRRRG